MSQYKYNKYKTKYMLAKINKQYGYGLQTIDRKNTCSREQLKKCDLTISSYNFPDITDIPPEILETVIKIDDRQYIPIGKIYFSQKIISSTFDNFKIDATHNLRSTLCALIHNIITVEQLPPIVISIFRYDNTYKFISFDNRRLCVYNYYKLYTNKDINIPIKFIKKSNLLTEIKKIYISCNISENNPLCSNVGLSISDIFIKYSGSFIPADTYYARIKDSLKLNSCTSMESISLHKLSDIIQKINNLKKDNIILRKKLFSKLYEIKQDIQNKYNYQLSDALVYISTINEKNIIYTNIKNELKLLDNIISKYDNLLLTIIQ